MWKNGIDSAQKFYSITIFFSYLYFIRSSDFEHRKMFHIVNDVHDVSYSAILFRAKSQANRAVLYFLFIWCANVTDWNDKNKIKNSRCYYQNQQILYYDFTIRWKNFLDFYFFFRSLFSSFISNSFHERYLLLALLKFVVFFCLFRCCWI